MLVGRRFLKWSDIEDAELTIERIGLNTLLSAKIKIVVSRAGKESYAAWIPFQHLDRVRAIMESRRFRVETRDPV